MQRIEPKLTPSVVLIIDDDVQRACAVADTLRAAFGHTAVRLRRWDQLAVGPDSLVDLAIIAPRISTPADTDSSLPDALAELKHIPTIVLASPGDPQAAVNAVLDGASDALIMQERYLDLLATRVSRTLARAHFRDKSDRRSPSRSSALSRTREENRRLRSRLGSLEVAAMLDPLTGLANRRALDARLADLWDTAVLANGELSCLLIDIDHFKRINDTLGHPAGDIVLSVLARVLVEQCRQDDIAARLGGDEFIAILPSATAQQALLVARRIQAAFDAAVIDALIKSHAVPPSAARADSLRFDPGRETYAASSASPNAPLAVPTLSIGVSSRTANRPTCAADLIAHADHALYAGKHAGRNRVALAAGTGAPASRLAPAG